MNRGITPAEAKKLCHGAVAFAAKYGLPPYPDYAQAVKVFDGVDDSTCETEFTFGKDGKPFYIVGPHDYPARQKRILDTLERTAGPGGYDFLIPDGEPTDDEWDDDLPEDDGWPPAPRQW